MMNPPFSHDGMTSRPRLAPAFSQQGFSRHALLCLAGIVGMAVGEWAAAEGNSGVLPTSGIGAWMDQPAETGEPAGFSGQEPGRPTPIRAVSSVSYGGMAPARDPRLLFVPEPSTLVFAGIGLAMGGWRIWKKRRLRQLTFRA